MGSHLRKYFTTGEFAKLCNVKKQTLFHYDEIGLLSPEYKSENGYRYYSYQQFDVFTVIELLKEVDMPLKEIKSFLNNRSPKELIELFKEKSIEIERKMDNLARIQKIIDTKISLTERALAIDDTQINIEIQEAEQLVISDSILNCSDREFLKLVSEFIAFCDANQLYVGYPIGGILSKEKLLQGDYENYSFLYTKIVDDPGNIPVYIKPKGLYVIAYHKGSYKKIFKTYEKILNFIEANQLKIKGDSYEEYVLDEISVNGYDNYVTQIAIEVVTI
ncbi:MerR family transcriptional regulator [Lederbergia lenta]|uniref:Transcriptional regulator n=1 Tax=Lederbergia lenta TaxID=1467 RepID=A0A2X4WHP0_LEDLE|nr:MerR family transcriptional regulator [Lederbergia lenta]MEC2324585.1 MerR family transcriptional regulator [Lederbergia lenta]SQI59398.1 transcriptional regulator [Lederbergia lenta]